MARLALRRLGAAVLVVFLGSLVVFAGVRALPGDPALALSGEDRDPVALAAIRHQFGLDRPVPVQFVKYVTNALHGNLGQSARNGIGVGRIILDRLPVTLELSLLAIAIAIAVGIPLGIFAAVRRGGAVDSVATMFGLVGLSVPNFWLGLLLILALSVKVHLFPASGFVPFLTDPVANLRHLVLPAAVLGVQLAAVLMRQMRSAMMESLSADYVRTARAKGLSEVQVVGVHALRNSLITVVTVLGLQLGALISGAVVTEQIFVIPGFGKLLVDSVFSRDYPVVQGAVLVAVAGYVAVNLAVDLTYSFLNPRIRIAGGPA
ncbi:MAG: ABC transporter permease [Acidimicrobiales bacterium]